MFGFQDSLTLGISSDLPLGEYGYFLEPHILSGKFHFSRADLNRILFISSNTPFVIPSTGYVVIVQHLLYTRPCCRSHRQDRCACVRMEGRDWRGVRLVHQADARLPWWKAPQHDSWWWWRPYQPCSWRIPSVYGRFVKFMAISLLKKRKCCQNMSWNFTVHQCHHLKWDLLLNTVSTILPINWTPWLVILVPRGCDPFGQHQDLWPASTPEFCHSQTHCQIWQIWLAENTKQVLCARYKNRVQPPLFEPWCWPN